MYCGFSYNQPRVCRGDESAVEKGDLKGHTVGNIILAALEQQTDFMKGVHVLNQLFNTAGTVIPVTVEPATLMARLADGTEVRGESAIDTGVHGATAAIEQVWLDPKPAATDEAVHAIRQADLVVYSIGDLFTSVVPNLLPTGITQAIAESSAKFVYACNQTSKLTETAGYSTWDYITTLQHYSERLVDYVIVNEANRNADVASGVVPFNASRLEEAGVSVVAADVAANTGATINGKALAKEIADLCQQL